MATFWQRLVMIFRSRRRARLDRRATSHQRVVQMIEAMETLVREAKLRAAQAAADARRLEELRDRQLASAQEWGRRATVALAEEREDLAAESIKRELALRDEATDLEATIAALQSRSVALYREVQDLDTRLEQARTRLRQLILRESTAQAQAEVRAIRDRLDDPWQGGDFDRLAVEMDRWHAELAVADLDRPEALDEQLRLVERHLPQIEERLAQARQNLAREQSGEPS
jgi:phage shock protein A